MTHRRWPFVARVLTVSAMLTALLAVAIVMLIVGRAQPVRAAAARTHTSVRTLPPRSSVAAPSSRAPGAPIVPPGLPMSAVRLSRPRHRAPSALAQRQAHAHAVAHEGAVLRRLAREIRLARLQHDLFVPHRRRSYNRRPRARSSAG